MVRSTLVLWEKLIGPAYSFSQENRTVNAVGVITFCILVLTFPVNFIIDLKGSAVISTVLLVTQAALYYLSRFKQKHQFAMIIYACFCYLALFVNFKYNSGIDGPSTLLFFLSFQLLVAITPRKQHKIWMTLHILIGVLLMLIEYQYPEFIKETYKDRWTKFFDISATYVISLSFVYIITHYLLVQYSKERKLAQQRATAIEAQNKALKEIAWIQSHKVRNHVATILGLTEILETYKDAETNERILSDIKQVAQELDGVIRTINGVAKDATQK